MAALTTPFLSAKFHHNRFPSGSSWKAMDQCLLDTSLCKLSTCMRPLIVRSGGDGRPSGASIFVGGFVVGGIVVGILGCVYAPQISKALAEADKKELMRKLPKFIYDEEKALEKTRKILTEKIAQLNSAIDEVSGQLHADDAPNDDTASPYETDPFIF